MKGMKILKRLGKVVAAILSLAVFPFEAVYYLSRWIITGKEFGVPIFGQILDS